MDAAMIACRLCGEPSAKQFQHRILGKYDVDYFQCGACGSLQTEMPYWLGEVYTSDIQPEDGEYLTRNLNVFRIVNFYLKNLRLKPDAVVLDFGGGLGIVPRLLREHGVNAYNYDTYTKSPFSDVTWDEKTAPDFIVSSEVFEHLPDPAAEVARIFSHEPDYVYVRTWRYFGQGKDWDYIGPEHGAHVFFYTDKAMQFIADKVGYGLILPSDGDALFCKTPLTNFQKRVVLRGLESRAARLVTKLASKFG
jgi:Methyltransferase domain